MVGVFERLVAFRYMRARRQEGFVSVIALFSLIGIMLGVGTLIVVMAVMDGFRHELLNRILALNGHLTVNVASVTLEDYNETSREIANLPGVRSSIPFLEGQALLMSDGKAAGVYVRGLSREGANSKIILRDSIKEGSLEQFAGQGVLMGKRLGDELGLKVGSQFAVTTSINRDDAEAEEVELSPKTNRFTVAGFFVMGMSDFDSSVVLMPLDTAQAFFETGRTITSFEVTAEQPDLADQIKDAIWRDVHAGFSIQDWQHSISGFLETVKTQQSMIFFILALIIIVAAFSIITGQVMLVNDKASDIAILRTVGASQRSILVIFLISGALIGVIGTILGVIGGVAFAWYIEPIRAFLEAATGQRLFDDKVYFLDQLPALLKMKTVFMIAGFSFILAFLSSLYPAWRAARTDPIEALRYE
jgi:lipoprotein-releasing system permease protein